MLSDGQGSVLQECMSEEDDDSSENGRSANEDADIEYAALHATGPMDAEEFNTYLDTVTNRDLANLSRWLSIRPHRLGATRRTVLRDTFALFPNYVRLAVDNFTFANSAVAHQLDVTEHRNRDLLESGITSGQGRETASFNADGLLSADLVYDASTGNYSRPDGAERQNERASPAPQGVSSPSRTDGLSESDESFIDKMERLGFSRQGGVSRAEVRELAESLAEQKLEDFKKKVNLGEIALDISAANASTKRLAKTYDLAEDFCLMSHDRAVPRSETKTVYDGTVESLQKATYESKVSKEQLRTVAARIQLPSAWREPGVVKPDHLALYSDAQLAADKAFREEQLKLVQPFKAIILALDHASNLGASLEELLVSLDEDYRDAESVSRDTSEDDVRKLVPHAVLRKRLQGFTDELLFTLSDAFHINARGMSVLHSQREDLRLQALEVDPSASMPKEEELAPGQFYMGGEDQEDDPVLARAKAHRVLQLERTRLLSTTKAAAKAPQGAGANWSKNRKRNQDRKARKNRKAQAAKPGSAPAPAPAPAAGAPKKPATKPAKTN